MKLRSCLLALVGLLLAAVSDAASSFLFISAPSSGAIYFSRLLDAMEQSRNAKMTSKKLAGVETIKEPHGLAVDSLRRILYAVDGNGGTPELYASKIYHRHDGTVASEAPKKLATGITGDWVAVDVRGTVFYVIDNQIVSMNITTVTNKLDGPGGLDEAVATVATDTVADTVETVDTAEAAVSFLQLATRADPEPVDTADTTASTVTAKANTEAKVLYDGGSNKAVSMPRGIAVDGYRMFWANAENGEQDGSVILGYENPVGAPAITALDKTLASAHGVCLTPSRVFFTDEEANLFSTKVNGGPMSTVTSKLQKPRGCVFDGDGTVFVADAGDNKVLSFAGAGAELGARRMSVSLTDITGPFGLAVFHKDHEDLYSGASRCAALIAVITTTLLSFVL